MKFLIRNIGLAVAVLLVSVSMLAQNSGTIKGQVTDQSGAVVTDATVTATPEKGAAVTATTNKQGVYELKGLAPGKYALSATAKGFSKFETSELAVEAGKPQTFDIPLEIAVTTEKVTVEDNATQVGVAADNNASQIVLKGKDLDALSDDPDDLQNDLLALAGPSAGPNGGQIYIDGFTGGTLPPKSAIREVRINTNPFSAEYDRIGYGRIEIFTKPGQDKFHGQAMFHFNNQIFNARNPFNHGTQPGYQTEMYNANVGGPLNKKASFFLSVERMKRDETSIINAVVLDNAFNPTPFSTAVPNPVTQTEISPRLDYQLSKNNTLTARYQFERRAIENGGISTFTLPSQATNSSSTEHSIQISDSQILSPTTINDTRFRYQRTQNASLALVNGVTLSVPSAFTSGGNRSGRSDDHTDRYEAQNSTRMTRGKHLITFGGRLRATRDANSSTSNYNGTFQFDSITAYQITRQGLANGWTQAAIRAAGGGASQYSVSAGTPLVTVSQADAGLFVEDNWNIRPNITLTYGLRFETQNNINDHADFAPRIGFAWGLGRVKNGPAKTVLRAGAGIFYDRFSDNNVMQAERLNGITQQQYLVALPDFTVDANGNPIAPPTTALAGAQVQPTTYRIGPSLKSPYMMQGAATLERQVTKSATISVTYLHSRGVHQLLLHNINAPLPGSGVRPLGGTGNVYQYDAAGIFKQDQIITNGNVRIAAKLTLNSFYMLNWANGNTSGPGSFPVNQYSLAGEYGRTAFAVRQRFFVGGNITAPYGFRLNPFIVVSSGQPFNITVGKDLNGDSIFNDRPAFASTTTCGGNIVCTPWGIFDKAPSAASQIIPLNYGTGPAQFSVNLRLSKTIGFGPSLGGERQAGGRGEGGPRGGPGGGDHGHGPGGGGMVRMGGGGGGGFGGTGKRYNLTFGINANNLFNRVNLDTPVGNLSSPLFGTSNSLARGFGGGQAANRRLSLQVIFAF